MKPASTRQQLHAGALALLVHLLFFAALVVGVSWKNPPVPPAMAELWSSLPALPPPPTPAPIPTPVEANEPPPQAEPDIALKKREEEETHKRLEQEKQRSEAEKQLRAEAERKKKQEEDAAKARQKALEDEARRAHDKAIEDERKAMEEKRRADEAKRQEQAEKRRLLAQAMAAEAAAEAADELAQERRQLAEARELATRAAAQAAAREKAIQDYRGRIVQKIRGVLRLPANLQGNPEVLFQVRLLANGEVTRVVLIQSSGQPAYDQEVERAILKASPLPLPPDKEASAAFREHLRLKFRPRDG